MSWKKVLICVMICLILPGCDASPKSDMQQALDLRASLLETGGCSFTAVIGADFGERVYSFSVSCDYTAGEGAKITVLQPEEISGIAARVSERGAVIEFEDLELDFGQLAEGNVSPMEAAWLLPHCWEGAYIDSVGQDGDLLRITFLDGYEDETLTVDTWLNTDKTPVYGEIIYEGVRCLTVEITQFQWKTD